MNPLRDLLFAHYSEHYRRANQVQAGNRLGLRARQTLELMFGRLLDSQPAGSRVLDVGCGSGLMLEWLHSRPNVVVEGVDLSLPQVEAAKRLLPDIAITCGDAVEFLERRPSAFHVVFATDLLEHLDDDAALLRFLRTVRAALVPGGAFVCRVPNAANLTGFQLRYIDATHTRSFTSMSLCQVLEVANFEDIAIVPVRAAHLSGRVRLHVEAALHRFVFLVCGDAAERTFTRTVSAVGYRKDKA